MRLSKSRSAGATGSARGRVHGPAMPDLPASLMWGDFSSVLAAAPALLGQSAYSRDFEREADDDLIALLRANGISPAVMAVLFERLAEHRQAQREATGFDLGIALASQPADEQRIQRFREAAAR